MNHPLRHTDEVRATELVAWYVENRRDLPWRAEPGELADPYAVLVSELMCQQTRVQTAAPYFERWMARWPTLQALANAHVDDVLQMWTGLGYYRRARHLLAAAQQAIAEHGQLPADHAALLQLRGVGPYTAAALASLGFGLPCALVDGNVSRVLARWFAIDVDVSRGPGNREVWRLAEQLLTAKDAARDPGTWNQALMELGATVCTPRRPGCATCPVAHHCAARRGGLELRLPVPKPRSAPKPVEAIAVVCLANGRALVAKRPGRGRWAGLWEPPLFEGAGAKAAASAWADAVGAHARRDAGRLTHVLSHRRYEVEVWALDLAAPDLAAAALDAAGAALDRYVAQRWADLDALLGEESGVSRLGQRALTRALPQL